MNGELMSMAQLTMLAKYYIKTGKIDTSLMKNQHIGSFQFTFAEQDFGSKAPAMQVDSRREWVEQLVARGAEDCKLLMVDELEDYSRLAFANGIPCCMLCFYDGGVTTWNKLWRFNQASKTWHVELVESICRDVPEGKPRFQDVSEPMVTLLERLRALAQKLGLSEYSRRFQTAQSALQQDFAQSDLMSPSHHRLMQAAIAAYVFGGQGSWNDDAKGIAAEKGLTEEYDRLTAELYRGIALSMMYAVNEW